MRTGLFCVVALCGVVARGPHAFAEEPVAPEPAEPPIAPPSEAPDTGLHDDSEFGPLILIESIEVVGNTATQTELIRRALPLQPGDVLHASDKRLREARFRVLALGFFRDVNLAMRKGSARGQVILEVSVVERGTVVLNRLWFGTSNVSPYWVGADVGERNLLGLGIGVGFGFIFASHGDVDGSRNQWATELRASDPSLLGSRWGLALAATLVHGSEVYRVTGDPQDVTAEDPRSRGSRSARARNRSPPICRSRRPSRSPTGAPRRSTSTSSPATAA